MACRVFTPEVCRCIVEMAPSQSLMQISKKLNLNYHSLANWCSTHGVKTCRETNYYKGLQSRISIVMDNDVRRAFHREARLLETDVATLLERTLAIIAHDDLFDSLLEDEVFPPRNNRRKADDENFDENFVNRGEGH